jgi:carbon storage regulator CsrA
MLVLTRKLGEKIHIGSASVKMFSIAKHALVLDMEINGNDSTVCVRSDQYTTVQIDGHCVYLEYLEMRGNQVRIGIDAPESINILRAELLYKKTSSGN